MLCKLFSHNEAETQIGGVSEQANKKSTRRLKKIS